MSKIQQPSNQIKLTNVSVVKLKKGGKRFEIACYKNKVQEWRNGVETNLDDVLQISNVFVNVSKGEVAKHGDLKKCFGTTDIPDIVTEILKKGEMQVNEKERDHDLSALRKEILNLETQRPLPRPGFSVKQNKTAKSQVSECIKLIQSNSTLPIQRARMRVRVTIPPADGKRLREKILEGAEKDEWEVVMLIDPGQFRVINEILQKECKGRGRIETMTFAATATN
ncbi:Shwachman-Bodian-diamond syndrome protein-domain-containing protein [Desarmillaria tabescens]|uniref:Ribosome maturation protein SDO1 n=1 Tax=Armillaria tabescens TaxID=1929756 RepID=A0AA39JPL5_ARMTA|nr:Shwachman-Bodian-diamond syndrome protein-domain-containing protein [Desarmillaria tabescens]KAK0446468.1 Shwachman-Bodian-diamond syndrome protein-domain-containing protein [Desarmillaria tabescens]